jgi:hypothetical protein
MKSGTRSREASTAPRVRAASSSPQRAGPGKPSYRPLPETRRCARRIPRCSPLSGCRSACGASSVRRRLVRARCDAARNFQMPPYAPELRDHFGVQLRVAPLSLVLAHAPVTFSLLARRMDNCRPNSSESQRKRRRAGLPPFVITPLDSVKEAVQTLFGSIMQT